MSLTHAQAAALHAKARDPQRGKPIDNNTYVVQRGDDYAVRFHATDVVTLHADGTYTLATDGWYSKTTAERINAYSPACIVVKRGKWYLARKAQRWYKGPLKYTRTVGWGERQPVTPENKAYRAAAKAWDAANLLPFADGMRVNAKGHHIKGHPPVPSEAPEVTTSAWRPEFGWSGPVTMADNRAAHAARIATLMGDLRERYTPPPPSDEFPFTVETPDGVKVYTMSNTMIRACDHFIMVPEHYREDRSCRCDDVNDPHMAEWGYTWNATDKRWA